MMEELPFQTVGQLTLPTPIVYLEVLDVLAVKSGVLWLKSFQHTSNGDPPVWERAHASSHSNRLYKDWSCVSWVDGWDSVCFGCPSSFLNSSGGPSGPEEMDEWRVDREGSKLAILDSKTSALNCRCMDICASSANVTVEGTCSTGRTQ